MLLYIGWTSQYPFLRTVSEVVYYGTIFSAIVVFLSLAAKRLHALGYPKKRLVLFTALAIGASYPLGHLGSRAAGMFYHPVEAWGFQLLLENMFQGTSHTFHASLVLPMLFGALLCYLFRFKILEVFDTAFLYLPLAHAFGRLSCLLVGCCWGRYVHLDLYGIRLDFQNPVPLYAIGVNGLIFLFLRRIHTHVYADAGTRERFRGVVLAAYCALYAPARIVLEVFRTEPKVLFGLTHAQVAMGGFLLFAFMLFVVMLHRYLKKRTAAPAPLGSAGQHALQELPKLFSLGGLMVSLVLFNFLIHYLTRQINAWPWPIQPVLSLGDAYARILYYLPMMLIPAYCLYWLKKSNISPGPWFAWNRFSYTFLLGLGISAYYAVEMLVLQQPTLRGMAFWPPVITLSLLNAAAEEIMYRLTLYHLLKRADYSPWVSNIVQALIYSLIHFMIAGALLGVLSFIYGLVMGRVVERSQSVTPAIVCHFIIDIGVFGAPLLRL
jgi:prolipoprotein diacylglyceryltransferase/membrane protease YdiL (CAAX protease family)